MPLFSKFRQKPSPFFILLILKTIKNSNRQMRQLYAYIANESTLNITKQIEASDVVNDSFVC